MNQIQRTVNQDSNFIRIVMGSTGLGLALMLGSLAAVRVNGENHYQFAWNWSVPIWMGAAAIANWRFWKSIWTAQDHPGYRTKRSAIFHGIGLAALAIGAFLYPLRFIDPGHFLSVAKGLATAVVFLGILGTFIFKIGRALSEDGKTE